MTNTQIPPPAAPIDPSYQEQIDDINAELDALGITIVYTDAEWAAVNPLVDGHWVRHLGRKATYYYEITTGVWSWYSGALTGDGVDPLPSVSVARNIHALDSRVVGSEAYSSTVDGIARLHDFTRNGTRRQEQPGRSFLFDGIMDNVQAVLQTNTYPITLSAWFRVNDVSARNSIISLCQSAAASQYVVIETNGTNLRVLRVAGTLEAVGVIQVDRWYHTALELTNATDSKLYLDGVLVGEATNGTENMTIIDAVTLGVFRAIAPAHWMDGAIHDARIFNRALTPTEIATIANKEIGPLDADGWWPCEEEGDSAKDISGNGNDGTVTATSASLFYDKTGINDVLSLENELGYHDEWLTNHDERMMLGDISETYSVFDGAWLFEADGMISLDDETTYLPLNTVIDDQIEYHVRFTVLESSVDFGLRLLGTLLTGQHTKAGNWSPSDAVDQPDHNVTESGGYITSTGVYHKTISTWGGAVSCLELHRSGAHTGTQKISNIEIWRTDGQPVKTFRNVPISSDLTNHVLGAPANYQGPAPHDSLLASPAPTFNGTTEYAVQADGSDRLTTGGVTDLTVAFWYTSSANGLHTIAGESDSGQIVWYVFTNSGTLRLATTDDGTAEYLSISDSTINDGNWHHIVVKKTGTLVEMFSDGEVLPCVSFAPATTFDGASAFAVGAKNTKTSPTWFWSGGLAGLQVWQSALSPTDVATLYAGGKVAGALADYPMADGGSVFHDVSGNGKHLSVNPVSIPTFWAGTQAHSDTLVKDGLARATQYDGSSYVQKPDDLFQSPPSVFASAWIYKTGSATAYITTQWASGSNRSWSMFVGSNEQLILGTSSDGVENLKLETASGTIPLNEWVHVATTYDSGVGKLYVNGGEVSPATGDVAASIFDANTQFTIGADTQGTTSWAGMLSDVLVGESVPSSADIAAMYAGTYKPPKAWYWRDGNEVESQQGLADLTIVGTPVATNVPAGADLPVTIGPGLLQPGQIASLQNGEALSPRAQHLATVLTNVDYTYGDGSQEDVLYIRQGADGEDRLQVFDEALTGSDKDKLEQDVS